MARMRARWPRSFPGWWRRVSRFHEPVAGRDRLPAGDHRRRGRGRHAHRRADGAGRGRQHDHRRQAAAAARRAAPAAAEPPASSRWPWPPRGVLAPSGEELPTAAAPRGGAAFSMLGGMIPATLFARWRCASRRANTVSTTTVGWMQQCSALEPVRRPPIDGTGWRHAGRLALDRAAPPARGLDRPAAGRVAGAHAARASRAELRRSARRGLRDSAAQRVDKLVGERDDGGLQRWPAPRRRRQIRCCDSRRRHRPRPRAASALDAHRKLPATGGDDDLLARLGRSRSHHRRRSPVRRCRAASQCPTAHPQPRAFASQRGAGFEPARCRPQRCGRGQCPIRQPGRWPKPACGEEGVLHGVALRVFGRCALSEPQYRSAGPWRGRNRGTPLPCSRHDFTLSSPLCWSRHICA